MTQGMGHDPAVAIWRCGREWIDQYAVINRDFSLFMEETCYVTPAEGPANPDDYLDAKPELLATSSIIGSCYTMQPVT